MPWALDTERILLGAGVGRDGIDAYERMERFCDL
jgi:hypothetical protein